MSMGRGTARPHWSSSRCHRAATPCTRSRRPGPRRTSGSRSSPGRSRRPAASSGRLARMLRGLVALVASVMFAGRALAAPDPLAQARAAVAASDYVAARPALVAALEAGGRGPDELAEIYRLTGVVAAALGDARAATDAF